jgi:hypothetical protein
MKLCLKAFFVLPPPHVLLYLTGPLKRALKNCLGSPPGLYYKNAVSKENLTLYFVADLIKITV